MWPGCKLQQPDARVNLLDVIKHAYRLPQVSKEAADLAHEVECTLEENWVVPLVGWETATQVGSLLSCPLHHLPKQHALAAAHDHCSWFEVHAGPARPCS